MQEVSALRSPLLDLMRASVVIAVAEGDYELLAHQLRQLSERQTQPPLEIIVADNGGGLSPSTINHSVVKLIDASARKGASFARNLGAAYTTGDALLFCDADDLVCPRWVAHHIKALESVPLTAGSIVPITRTDDRYLSARRGSWPENLPVGGLVHHEGLAIAASNNMGVLRDAFDRAGGFPEAYPRSQDVAFSLSMRVFGAEPAFVPGAQVLYLQGKRNWRQAVRTDFRAGRSRVRIAREFEVGPSPRALAARAAGRSGRSVVRALSPRHSAASGDFSTQVSQLVGVLVEATVGQRWQ